ncbi:MAG: filamentous hemagglutinin N-terminal domain-containing protein, partial [Thermomonas sp.]
MRTKLSTQRIRTLRRRRLALALVAAMAAPVAMAQNLPESGNVVSGTATIDPGGAKLTINQSSRGAIIDWGTFNIGSGYGVDFQNGSGVTLNRVIGYGYGPSASSINGSLTATGSVFLVNTAGITFGNGSYVNVGGLVASTLALSNTDFNNGVSSGSYKFANATGSPTITNQSKIAYDKNLQPISGIFSGSGGVAFVGPTLRNSGDIVANGGNIAFGAGTSVTLDYFGDGLTQVTINGTPAILSSILQAQSGSMTADGGKILLRSAETVTGDGGDISISGTLRAQTLSNVAGRVELTSAGGPVTLGAIQFNDAVLLAAIDVGLFAAPGSIDVSGGPGQSGGSVLMSGDGAALLGASSIDATGYAGGGSVEIVGKYGILMATDSSIDVSGLAGDGGSISLTASQGPVYMGGILYANGDINGGSIALTGAASQYYGDGGYYTTDAINVTGRIEANGDSGNGGIVTVEGYGAVVISESIHANGGVDGGQIRLTASDGLYGPGSIYTTGSLEATGTTGNGGLINVYSTGDTVVYGDLLAWGGTNGGDITITGTSVDFYSALAYGETGTGGSVSVTADNIELYGDGNEIDVHGETGGGSIDLYARNNLVLSQDASLSADTGSSGNGGSIHLYAGNSLIAYGDLSARGVDGGGSIFTGSGGGIDLDGITVDAGTINGDAGTWTISAPQLTVINGANQGYIGDGYYVATTTDVQDYDLNNAFATGTNIVLEATSGSIDFDAPQIVSAFSSPLFLHVNATGAITGSGFSISSDGAALEMLFNADSAGGNANGGYIDFTNASLSSAGGLIAMYGQSDLASGFATGVANGISLSGVDIDSGGGGVILHGNSTGAKAGAGDAGVLLDGTSIYSYGGYIDIHGTGAGLANGVYASYTSLFSGGGSIVVNGEAGAGNGIGFGGTIESAGGDVTMYGQSVIAIGLVFGGYESGIVSAGGDIGLTGIGQTGGVALSGYNGYNAINSGGGQLMVKGTASGTDAIGVYIDGMQLIGGTGDVTVNGSAPMGTGVAFANGAGITTTSGAITLIGTGASFGLDLDFGDGALTTDSGDIGLYGYALAASATAGVHLTGSGLATNGGAITIFGETAGGVGVQLGDGIDPFAIASGGGAISVTGSGVTAGVLMQNNQVASGGGAITIDGSGSDAGLVLRDSTIGSANGAIDLIGSALG